jgi:hypothetical protein
VRSAVEGRSARPLPRSCARGRTAAQYSWGDPTAAGTLAAVIARNRPVRKSHAHLFVALVAVLLGLAAVPALASAAAKEYTVNVKSIGPGNAGCETPGSPEECTLPAAIELANGNPGKDIIKFDPTVFQGAAPFATITLASALPLVTEAVEILGGRCNTGWGLEGPCVELTLNATASTSILTVSANQVTVEGLAFEGAGNGIRVEESATGFAAANDWFGAGLNRGTGTGNAAAGIRLEAGADAATIGGTEASERNVFARGGVGIELEGASLATITGNYIGVNPEGSGTVTLGTGVKIADSAAIEARFDQIGGALSPAALATEECDGLCNVIATDEGHGIDLGGDSGGPGTAAAGPTAILGNYIGLAADGKTVVGSNESGIAAYPPAGGCSAGPGGVTVGGAKPGEANFIDGGSVGISAEKSESLSVIGNSIGMGADGGQVDGPAVFGIELCNTGVLHASKITDNQMMLSPSTTAIQSVNGNAQITGNQIEGSSIGVELRSNNGEGAATVSGNTISEPDVDGILIESESNVVTGNAISKAGRSGILLETDADHNRIGGDGPAEANTIVETVGAEPEDAAIALFGRETGRDEIAANSGFDNPGAFITLIGHGGPEKPNGGIQPPALGVVLQSSASGTAAPNATVRVFTKDRPEAGELGSLLAVVKADPTGYWRATFAKQPISTLVAATQTSDAGTPEAGTSEVSLPLAASADPEEKEKEKEGGGGEGGGNGGGSSRSNLSGGSSTSATTSAPPAEVAPKVTITKAPRKSSTATIAKFTFKATPAAGAKFQCKLDNAKWASCGSPKTYKKLKPGKHTFQVRASAAGLTGAAAKFKFAIKA